MKQKTIRIANDDVRDARELSDEELMQVAGGGRSGGPICPKCHSTDVVYNADLGVVISCNVCGYHV